MTFDEARFCTCISRNVRKNGFVEGFVAARSVGISNGEIIEQFPEYWLNPACLIFGLDANDGILHVVVGVDEFVYVATAYRPDSATFMPDMKTRREG